MVYATLEESIIALNHAEGALQSTLDDIQDRIKQGYVKEMKGDEVHKVQTAFNTIESILDQLNKTRTRFEKVREDFKKLTE
jgi:cell fate (sporulation/competence/biofilm development) regulator YlbF (YheA/YmcA/DUF963 family)